MESMTRMMQNVLSPILGTPAMSGDGFPALGTGPLWAACDVQEDDKAFTLTVDMPGLSRSDVHLTVDDNNVLCLSGERKTEAVKEDAVMKRVERNYGTFQRRFRMPQTVTDVDSICAELNNGVLRARPAAAAAVAAALRRWQRLLGCVLTAAHLLPARGSLPSLIAHAFAAAARVAAGHHPEGPEEAGGEEAEGDLHQRGQRRERQQDDCLEGVAAAPHTAACRPTRGELLSACARRRERALTTTK